MNIFIIFFCSAFFFQPTENRPIGTISMLKKIIRSKIFIGSSVLVTTAIGINYFGLPSLKKKPEPLEKLLELPKREEHVKNLKNEEFDILIIGINFINL